MEESRKCTERELPKEEEAKRAAKAAANRARAKQYEALQNQQSQSIKSSHDFADAVKIRMTATQVDAVEKETFHNPAGWGRTVNTTVTANGTTEQWVYRFSLSHGAHDLYLYFQNGVLTAVQK
jgi:hypothetical protein